MIVLDENIPESQRELVHSHGLSAVQIGVQVGRKGMKDREVVSLMHELNRATFFTLDADFYRRGLCHLRYCLVHLDVDEDNAAAFVRQLLRLRHFSSHAKRMGAVIRVTWTGVSFWRKRATREVRLTWKE